MQNVDEIRQPPCNVRAAAEDVYSIETGRCTSRKARVHPDLPCITARLISPLTAPERDGWWFDLERSGAATDECLRVDYDLNLAGLRVISELFSEVDDWREECAPARS